MLQHSGAPEAVADAQNGFDAGSLVETVIH